MSKSTGWINKARLNSSPMYYTPDGRPIPPVYHHRIPRRRIPPWRRRGCVLGCLAALAVPVFCVLTFLLTYLLFPPSPTDIVILGLDARPGEGYVTRTDSIMLLNITPGSLDVSLLSIPRDVFVRVPGYGEQRINTINVLGEQDAVGGGPDLVKASLAESFGIGVDHYVRLNFEGFASLIDAVGGVTIDVPKLIVDYAFPTAGGGTTTIRFEPGRQHMNGEEALQYARTRHQDDDYRRTERQQQVLDALVKKLADPRYVIYWPAALSAIQSNMDTDLSILEMLRLGPGLFLGWPGSDRRVLEREDLIGRQAGYWVPDYDQLLPWIEARFD